MEEQTLSREIRWQGKLVVIENVPMGVCAQCSEKVLKPEVVKAIDQIIAERRDPKRTIRVPVFRYEPVIA